MLLGDVRSYFFSLLDAMPNLPCATVNFLPMSHLFLCSLEDCNRHRYRPRQTANHYWFAQLKPRILTRKRHTYLSMSSGWDPFWFCVVLLKRSFGLATAQLEFTRTLPQFNFEGPSRLTDSNGPNLWSAHAFRPLHRSGGFEVANELLWE